MARGYDIGGLLARSGALQGQQMAEGYNQLGQGLSGLFTGVADVVERGRERKQEAASQQQFQQLLERYKNDPAGMQREGLTKAASSNPTDQRLGKLLLEEAARIAGVRQKQTQALEVAGQQSQKEAQRKRAVQVATQSNDKNALVALRAGALDPVEYLKSRVTAGGVETVSVSPGGALVDKKTGEVLYERPFKPEAAPASKGIKTVERKDGSVSVLDADDGSVIQTLPAPGKGKGDRDASLNLIAQTTAFIQEIDDLMDPGFMETGFVGGVTAGVPGFPAYDREKELLSIRARLGFDQINEMKRLAAESGASGTGLGQISNIEFMSLQSTIDAIYTGMSAEAQNEALTKIKAHLLNVQKLASGVAPADAIEWERPEYKAVGYHKDSETGNVYYAPDGKNGTVYKLVDGEFVKLGAYLGSTSVE